MFSVGEILVGKKHSPYHITGVGVIVEVRKQCHAEYLTVSPLYGLYAGDIFHVKSMHFERVHTQLENE